MDYGKMKVAELRALCNQRGIQLYPTPVEKAVKADLVMALMDNDRVQVVDAEVIETDIQPKAAFDISLADVNSDLAALTDAVNRAQDALEEFGCSGEVMDGMAADELKVCEDALSAIVKEADDARLKLGRDYRSPLDEANALYRQFMAPVEELRDAYKTRRQQLRRRGLEATYIDFCEANGVPSLAIAVPFQRLLDAHPQWMRRDANAGRSAMAVEEAARKIIDDWGVLAKQKPSMEHYAEAEAVFFETLDLTAALRRESELSEQVRRIETARVEKEEAEEWVERRLVKDEGPERRRYRFEAWLDERELASFREWKTACGIGIGWTFKEIRNG